MRARAHREALPDRIACPQAFLLSLEPHPQVPDGNVPGHGDQHEQEAVDEAALGASEAVEAAPPPQEFLQPAGDAGGGDGIPGAGDMDEGLLPIAFYAAGGPGVRVVH